MTLTTNTGSVQKRQLSGYLPVHVTRAQVEYRLDLARRRTTALTARMQPKYARIINFLYGPMLKVIGFFYRSYTSNRARLQRFKAHQGVAGTLRFLTVLVVVGWILIWMTASDESRTRLTDQIKQTIGGFDSAVPEPGAPNVD